MLFLSLCCVRGVGFQAMDARCVSLEDTSPYQLQIVHRFLCCFQLEFPLFPATSDAVRLLFSWNCAAQSGHVWQSQALCVDLYFCQELG